MIIIHHSFLKLEDDESFRDKVCRSGKARRSLVNVAWGGGWYGWCVNVCQCVAWYCTVWHGIIWYGMFWYSVVGFGVVW